MPEHIMNLIWIEINKCDSIEEKKNLLQLYVTKLEDILTDINYQPWEYD